MRPGPYGILVPTMTDQKLRTVRLSLFQAPTRELSNFALCLNHLTENVLLVLNNVPQCFPFEKCDDTEEMTIHVCQSRVRGREHWDQEHFRVSCHNSLIR